LRAERTIQEKHFQTERNTTLHGPDLTRNVFSQPFGAWGHPPEFATHRFQVHRKFLRPGTLVKTLCNIGHYPRTTQPRHFSTTATTLQSGPRSMAVPIPTP